MLKFCLTERTYYRDPTTTQNFVRIAQGACRYCIASWRWCILISSLLVEHPALAARLDLCFRSVYFFYPGISFEPLNLSQQKFARWRQLVRNRTWRVSFFEFLRGVRLGAKNVTFCPNLPGVTFTKYNMAPKRRTISKIENCLVLAG